MPFSIFRHLAEASLFVVLFQVIVVKSFVKIVRVKPFIVAHTIVLLLCVMSVTHYSSKILNRIFIRPFPMCKICHPLLVNFDDKHLQLLLLLLLLLLSR